MCGCLAFIPVFGILFAIAALITGVLAYGRIARHGSGLRGEGLAVAGIVLGAVGLVLGFILFMMAAIAVPGFLRARSVANEQSAESRMERLGTALENYAAAQGHYPASLDELGTQEAPDVEGSHGVGTVGGYTYFVALSPDAYRITAAPSTCGTTGDTVFRLTNGAALKKERCVPEGD